MFLKLLRSHTQTASIFGMTFNFVQGNGIVLVDLVIHFIENIGCDVRISFGVFFVERLLKLFHLTQRVKFITIN